MQQQQANLDRSFRVAWLGPVGEGGHVAGMGGLLLEGLLSQGIQVDFYCSFEELPESFSQYDNLTIVSTPTYWEWHRWYSNSSFSAFLSSLVARTRAYNRLCDRLLERHATNPYSCVFQLSQTELFKLGNHLDQLPPVIVYPCVHAAGELRWHRRESAYALQSEKMWMHYLVRAFLTYRSWVQKRELRKPDLIVGMSQRFNDLVAIDYDVSPDRQAVLYHPILPQDQAVASSSDDLAHQRTVCRLLFVSRISVRKGVQHIIELSDRLSDLAGQIQIDVIGGHSQWSNYQAHLKDLNPKTAEYLGGKSHTEVMLAYSEADILLLPSLYEPGGIVVGEALAHGLCVVTSDAVGSAEVLDADCYRAFTAGDMDEFEQQVRTLINDLKVRRQELRDAAREQCKKHFTPEAIAKRLARLMERTATDNAQMADSIVPEQATVS